MELKSLTPLAEFVDIVYTRCAIELTPVVALRWWVELRPPVSAEQGNGTVYIKGVVDRNHLHQMCKFDAVTEGVSVGLDEMTTVADYHIAEFKAIAKAHGGDA